MAESQPSPPLISQQIPTWKQWLGLLLPNATPSEPILDIPVFEARENALNDENGEEELRDIIEKEIYLLSLEQAEIDAARDVSEAIDDVKDGIDLKSVEKYHLDEEKNDEYVGNFDKEIEVEGVADGVSVGWDDFNGEKNWKDADDFDGQKNWKDTESFEEYNENERGGEENVGEQSGNRVERYTIGQNRRKMNYPMRPDAEDCAYYMKFGACKFGSNCKFNHPPRRKNQGVKVRNMEENSERPGQTECKYYLTSGGCKYGKDCKYSHASEKSPFSHIPELNFLGLPIRMGEKECPYYMRTGSCKYGSNCRFHHPDPTTVGGGDPGYGNGGSLPSQHVSSSSVSSWSPPRAITENSPYPPAMFPPTQGASSTKSEWNSYQGSTYSTSERGLPTPPAFTMNNLSTGMNFRMPHQHSMLVEEYPERPGEPECSFFIKTGDCKFKSNCKFHHPKNRASKAKANNANSFTLSDKGLPLRPGQPICAHYNQYGICKYGPGCKYDHPSKFGSSPFDQPAYGHSNVVDGADRQRKVNKSGIAA